MKVDVDSVLEVLEVYCSACRRTYDDVGDAPCAAAEGNAHLIGGPVGTRKKRTHDDHDCGLFGCDPSRTELDDLRRTAVEIEVQSAAHVRKPDIAGRRHQAS